MRFMAVFLIIAALSQAQDLSQRVIALLGRGVRPQVESLLRAKRFADVEALVSAVPALTPLQQSEQFAVRGGLDFVSGNMKSAVKCFQQASALHPLSEPDQFTLAMAFVRLGSEEEARSTLTTLAQSDPGAALYPYWLGRIDYAQRRYESAVALLTKATVLDAKSARAWDSLGLAYDMQGKADQARQAFAQGASVNRQQANPSPWPPHDLGALLLRIGHTKEAETAFKEALQYDPQMEQAHYHLGRALDKDGVNDGAVKEYKIAMQEDPSATDVCYSLAILYRKMQRTVDADAAFAEWRHRSANH
jgi:tetratricopeptide (TPR) repeat protein